MVELLTRFSLTEVLIAITLFAIAVKGVVSFYDWALDRLKKAYHIRQMPQQLHEDSISRIESNRQEFEEIKRFQGSLAERQDKIEEHLDGFEKKIDLLIESDKDDIKSYITEKYDLFVKEKGKIDKYNLDCIERRYEHYKEENGNSFVADLVKEIRRLPIDQ